MGLIIVLSVFNGFSDLVVTLYNSFDPDIKITAVKGKSFDPVDLKKENLRTIQGIEAVTYTLEENGLVKHNDRQFIATIKGVDTEFTNVNPVSDYMVDGDFTLSDDQGQYAILGSIVAYSLGIYLEDPLAQVNLYVPKKGSRINTLDPTSAFNQKLVRPSGVFAIQQDFDSKYLIIPLSLAREVIGTENNISAIEVKVSDDADINEVRESILALTGPSFDVKTRLMQHDLLYRILKSEKWAVFFILTFILIIAIFNIIGSMTMLIIEKKKDISLLKALGATRSMVRKIFLIEGTLVVMTGAILGVTLGFVVCYLQQEFEFVRLDNAESFIIEAYPVAMNPVDFISVIGTVFLIGIAASFYTSKVLVDKNQVKLA